MKAMKSAAISLAFSLLPYLTVAWAYTQWVNGDNSQLWPALLVLIGARLFFSIIETLGSVLAWHLYGKRQAVQANLQLLRQGNYPKREYAHETFWNYLLRVEDEPRYDADLRASAKQWHFALGMWEQMGILVGMRMHAATDAALDIYSPNSEAPLFGQAAA
jgi:hypothetical protein